MRATDELIVAADCGELDWLCCLSVDRLLELRDILDRMSNADVLRLHKIACACVVRAAPSAGATPPATTAPSSAQTLNTCLARLLGTLCSDNGRSVLTGMTTVLIGLIANVPEPKAKATLLALLAGVEAADAACDHRAISEEAAAKICAGLLGFRSKWNDMPQFVKTTLSVLGPGGVADVILARVYDCCAAGVHAAPGE